MRYDPSAPPLKAIIYMVSPLWFYTPPLTIVAQSPPKKQSIATALCSRILSSSVSGFHGYHPSVHHWYITQSEICCSKAQKMRILVLNILLQTQTSSVFRAMHCKLRILPWNEMEQKCLWTAKQFYSFNIVGSSFDPVSNASHKSH